MSSVGARLRKLRKEKGLTQTEVTGGQYSKEYVSQVELGKTRPSRKAVRLFAKHLDVDESYFETGIDLAGRERFENLMANGEVLIERKEYAEALRVFEEARIIGEKAENPDFVWRAEVGRAWALRYSGKLREALVILTDARSYYEERRPDSIELAVVLYRLGCCRETMGDLKLALLLLEESLKVVDRGPVPADQLRIRVFRRVAAIHTGRHDLEAGREAAESALELAKGLEDRRAVAEAYWEAAILEERRRDFTKATEYALRARDLLADLGDKQETARLLNNLGDIKNEQGRPQDGIQYFEDGLEVLQTVDDPITRSYLLNGLAAARLAMGESQPSLEAANKSLAIMEGRDNHVTLVGSSHLIRARAFLQQRQLEECWDELTKAKRLFEPLEWPRYLSGTLLVEGDLLLVEGQAEAAARAFKRSSELVQEVRW